MNRLEDFEEKYVQQIPKKVKTAAYRDTNDDFRCSVAEVSSFIYTASKIAHLAIVVVASSTPSIMAANAVVSFMLVFQPC